MILLIFSGTLISGCIDNPMKEVPVVKVNITFAEKEGFVEAVEYDFSPGSVNFLNRPKRDEAPFPAIAARTMIAKGQNSSIGQWETLPYTGQGTYSFNIGFLEKKYPVPDDIVHISIYVVDIKGDRIGFFKNDIIWK